MTAICGGGTSSAQSGYGEALYMVPSMVGALLNNIPTLWAVPLAGFIGSVTYNLSTFCTTDPPPVPTFTAQDVIDLLNPYNPLPYNDAQSKFQQLVGAYAWYQVCKCDTVATPAAPSAPAAPTGMPSINPPAVAPTYPTGTPCFVADFTGHLGTGNTGGFTSPRYPRDPAMTTITLSMSESHSGFVSPEQWAWVIRQFNSSGTFLGSATGVGDNGVAGPTSSASASLNAACATFDLDLSCNNLTSTVDVDLHCQIFCGSATAGGPVPQPCPTDPFVLATLEQIKALVTLIQRQAVPFAYIAGTAHSGLSGDGHIDVQGLIGCKVQLDTYGAGVGIEAGDPDEFFEAGWIVWSNDDGATKREWITHSPFVSLPAAAGQFTRIGYTLHSGVTATLTELEREP